MSWLLCGQFCYQQVGGDCWPADKQPLISLFPSEMDNFCFSSCFVLSLHVKSTECVNQVHLLQGKRIIDGDA